MSWKKVGPEVDTARRILLGLEEKYDILKKSNGIFIAEATSGIKSNNFSEEVLSQKLGAIYWIFLAQVMKKHLVLRNIG